MRDADEAFGVEGLVDEVEGVEGDRLPAVVDLLREERCECMTAVHAGLDFLPEVAHELQVLYWLAAGGHGGFVVNTARAEAGNAVPRKSIVRFNDKTKVKSALPTPTGTPHR